MYKYNNIDLLTDKILDYVHTCSKRQTQQFILDLLSIDAARDKILDIMYKHNNLYLIY